MIVSEDQEIRAEHLPLNVRASSATPVADTPAAGQPLPTLEELERAHIEAALRATGGHRGRAAAILGISERNLYRRIRDLDLSR